MVKSLKVGVFSRKLEDSFSSQVLLENCVMTGNKKSGALVRDGSDVSFKSCRFEGNGEYGLYVSDADATLVGCNQSSAGGTVAEPARAPLEASGEFVPGPPWIEGVSAALPVGQKSLQTAVGGRLGGGTGALRETAAERSLRPPERVLPHCVPSVVQGEGGRERGAVGEGDTRAPQWSRHEDERWKTEVLGGEGRASLSLPARAAARASGTGGGGKETERERDTGRAEDERLSSEPGAGVRAEVLVDLRWGHPLKGVVTGRARVLLHVALDLLGREALKGVLIGEEAPAEQDSPRVAAPPFLEHGIVLRAVGVHPWVVHPGNH
eukprot:CAMPEP_0177609050 /NCGR_PEP_ID=MMETSP0419_2-20121207/18847_1 /TAXON_ID=582737 /ORGANISM="Tetraselmis sp., Strain GSL018" /LENGTH=322 /DNA_ID=CAMNT_0019103879 /DNA_START=363 /DNA_END=1333 /DNA_ORIENTATION=+